MLPEEKVYCQMGSIKGDRPRNHVPGVMMDGLIPEIRQYNACPQSLRSPPDIGRQ